MGLSARRQRRLPTPLERRRGARHREGTVGARCQRQRTVDRAPVSGTHEWGRRTQPRIDPIAASRTARILELPQGSLREYPRSHRQRHARDARAVETGESRKNSIK